MMPLPMLKFSVPSQMHELYMESGLRITHLESQKEVVLYLGKSGTDTIIDVDAGIEIQVSFDMIGGRQVWVLPQRADVRIWSPCVPMTATMGKGEDFDAVKMKDFDAVGSRERGRDLAILVQSPQIGEVFEALDVLASRPLLSFKAAEPRNRHGGIPNLDDVTTTSKKDAAKDDVTTASKKDASPTSRKVAKRQWTDASETQFEKKVKR